MLVELLSLTALLTAVDGSITSSYETRPRIIVYEGNIIFHAGSGRNITFVADDEGTIMFDDLDIKTLPMIAQVHVYKQEMDSYQAIMNTRVEEMVGLQVEQLRIRDSLNALQVQIANLQNTSSSNTDQPRNIRKQLRQLTNTFNQLKALVDKDDCSSHPCQNAGTCIDAIGKYYCLCLPEFEGANCSVDIDECLNLRGSDIACQNGGTCINTHGGFQCQCPPNWFGYRCTEKHDDCNPAIGSHALCGPHGTCITVQRTAVNVAAYKCICELGWAADNSINPRCVDINECQIRNPCYPGSACINIPGSFRCSNCPPGFTGNGLQCADIDECATNNGGCSKIPLVHCVNTHGSFRCGPCPPGYRGDGITCTPSNICETNPCHPNADCFEMPDTERGFRCQCRNNEVGNGIGATGCDISSRNPCLPESPCLNGGTCQATSATAFVCHCGWGFAGQTCGIASGCFSAPCRNGGTCISAADGSYECRCSRGYYGSDCSIRQDSCGERTQLVPSGTFKYPTNDSVYDHLAVCTWSITVERNKMIRLKFNEFALEAARAEPLCRFDNLTLYDGPNEIAPIIGIYCGLLGTPSAPPTELVSTTETMFLKFMSDQTVAHGGFTVSWKTVESSEVCGGRLSDTRGVITPPRINNKYAPGVLCRWIVATIPGFHYSISVAPVFLNAEDANCTGDVLEIRDGQRPEDPILDQICTNRPTRTPTIFTSMPYIFVYFISANVPQSANATETGFEITFEAQRLDTACGGVLSEQSGVIQSPNFGTGFYYNNLSCIWVIDGRPHSSSSIKLEFLVFDLSGLRFGTALRSHELWNLGRRNVSRNFTYRRPPMRPYCTGDSVEIRDGGQEVNTLLARYCGNYIVPKAPIISTGSQMWIRFRSDTSSSGRGFSAMYSAGCGRIYRSQNGTIQSPNFPAPSTTPRTCEYEIVAPKTHSIELNITSIDLGNDSPFKCDNNYLEFQTLPNFFYQNRRFCSLNLNRLFSGSGGSFKIKFVTDGSPKNKGFQAFFRTQDVGCGGVLIGSKGVIRSPVDGSEYLHHLHCLWLIQVPTDKKAKLTFTSFSVEDQRDCIYDSVSVYESYTNDNVSTGFFGKYCGSTIPPPLISTTNTLAVLFISDHNVRSGGFEALFKAVDLNEDCDRTFTAESGMISVPQSANSETTNVECLYHIRVARKMKILLTIRNISLPCSYSYLEIRNGPYSTSPPIIGLRDTRLCNGVAVESFKSQSNALLIKFVIERRYQINRPNVYFNLTYEQLHEGCGDVVTGMAGTVSSPHHPLPSLERLDCTYLIHVADGNKISFSLMTLDIRTRPTGECDFWSSFVEIRDGSDPASHMLYHICRPGSYPDRIVSSTNQMLIRYHQFPDVGSMTRGFSAHFSTECNKITLRGAFGRLSSPGFGAPVPAQRSCRWIINVARGNQLIAHVTYFFVRNGLESVRSGVTVDGCAGNYLQFVPGDVRMITLNNFINVTDRVTFCTEIATPTWIFSDSHKLEVRFESKDVMENHFSLEWSLSPNSCGNTLLTTPGTISINNDAGNQEVTMHQCQFSIKAPPTKQISLTILNLNIQNFERNVCPNASEYLAPLPDDTFLSGLIQIYNGIDDSSNAPTKSHCTYVAADKAFSVISLTNEMFIDVYYLRNKITGSTDGDGRQLVFLANYTFVDGTCGNNITALEGYIHSPKYPQRPATDIGCTWLITVPIGYIIRIDIVDLYISQNSFDCGRDTYPASRDNFVEIFDDVNGTKSLMRRSCADKTVDVRQIFSTGNIMMIRFQSTPTVFHTTAYLSFQFRFRTTCGARLVADNTQKILDSSDFNQVLRQSNSSCDWIIKSATPGDQVRFYITSLNIPDCSQQGLIVYDGETAQENRTSSRFCGYLVSREFVSTGSTLHVVLDIGNSTGHFSAIYSTLSSSCGGDVYDGSGFLTSPYYPDQYHRGTECVWTVIAGSGNFVKISLLTVQLDTDEECDNDFLEIRERERGGRLLERICLLAQNKILKIEEAAWIRFLSTEEGVGAQFCVTYQLDFGGSLAGTSGVIESPFYRQMQYMNFDTVTPVHYQTPTMNNNIITSAMALTNEKNILWTIEAPSGSVLQMNFQYLTLVSVTTSEQGRSTCVAQMVELYNGRCTVSTEPDRLASCDLWKRYCNVAGPTSATSEGNLVSVRFIIDQSISTSGSRFRLAWSAVSAAILPPSSNESSVCNNRLFEAELYEQSLTSPNYPNAYPLRTTCYWQIKHPRNYSVIIDFVDLDVERHRLCIHDYVLIDQSATTVVPMQGIYGGYHRPPQNRDRYCIKPNQPLVFKEIPVVNVVFFSDTSVTGRGFNLTYKLGCGSQFALTNRQVLTSPDYPANYPPNSDCAWSITGLPDRVIRVLFYSMNLQQSPNCAADYVAIYNGLSNTAPLLKKICGGGTPDNVIETTANAVYIEFHSDDTISAEGFMLFVEPKQHDCSDDRLTLTYGAPSGELMTPNFPEAYAVVMDCIWIISSPSGTRIQMDFNSEEFRLEGPRGNECTYDYLELRDGTSLIAPLIGRFCGRVAPSTQYSTRNYLFARFVSDYSSNHMGFRAVYQIAKCGGTIITQTSGEITSNMIMSDRTRNALCEWLIIAPSGHNIEFQVTYITNNVADYTNCTNIGSDITVVEVREYNASGTLYGEICSGATQKPKQRTASNRLYVRVRSDVTLTRGSFRIFYNVSTDTCGGTVTDLTGSISTPNYPQFYPVHRLCKWLITAPIGRKVTITFVDLHIPEGEEIRCPYDFVKIYEGTTSESPLIETFCGITTPRTPISSSGRNMLVHFFSDATVAGRGFLLNYQSTELADCGGVVDPANSTITVARSNNKRMHCTWYIYSDPMLNETIEVHFTSVNLSTVRSCEGDRINVMGSSARSSLNSDPQQICGDGTFQDISYLFWHSTIEIIYEGYAESSSFNFMVTRHACGGLVAGDTGVITSPNYPQPYNEHMHCQWLIVAPRGVQIRVNFTDVSLETSPGDHCIYDYVEVRNGPYVTSPKIERFCSLGPANADRAVLTSSGHAMLVSFVSDFSEVRRGFRLEYKQVTDGCGMVLSGRNGSITSPNYPRSYPANRFCRWEITTPVGFHTELKFNVLDISRSPNCTHDYILVEQQSGRDSDGQWEPTGEPMCGYDTPDFITSTNNHMRVTFKSDATRSGSGFNITYRSVCGADYSSPGGTIRSPYYPRPYENHMNCEYTIQTSNDTMQYVLLTFDDFDMEQDRTGCQDFVEVIQMLDNRVVAKLCGRTLPNPVSTKGPMKLIFSTDVSTVHKGFLANYVLSDCGGEIPLGSYNRAPYIFNSPGYPARYHDNMLCVWTITTRPDMVITAKFNEFNLEFQSQCNYDNVEVRDGNTTSARLLGRVCGKQDQPFSFTSTTNSMVIRLYTDSSNTEVGGFSVQLSSTLGEEAGCGGTINATTSGTIRSPGFDPATNTTNTLTEDGGRDESRYFNLHCKWHLFGPQNMVFRIKKKFFKLERAGHRGCYDYVELHDGLFSAAPEIGKFCGDDFPNELTTSTSNLYIGFVSDVSIVEDGFELQYELIPTVCGAEYQATAVKSFISYETPVEMRSQRCQWKISAPFLRDRISIDVISINYPVSRTCDNSYLLFTELPKTPTSASVRECGSSPVPYRSGTSAVLLTSVTEPGATYATSFNLTYRVLPTCNFDLELSENSFGGRITSPGYPDPYPIDKLCKTTLKAPAGYTISLYFAEFKLEQPRQVNCAYDYLKIENVASPGSITVGQSQSSNSVTYCGFTLPPSYISTSNEVQITFKSDNSIAQAGFDLTYTFSNRVCGGPISDVSGTITSPLYPSVYPVDSNCQWFIRVRRGRKISLRIITTFGAECAGDKLRVMDGVEGNERILLSICTTTENVHTETVDTNAIIVIFVSDAVVRDEERNFRLIFQETSE